MTERHHPSIHDYSAPVQSFWEASAGEPVENAPPLTTRDEVDVAIVGGGVTGLNAALALAEDHGRSVAVVEAGPIGWGASGRNGGFCCLGSTKLGWSTIIERFGLEEARAFLDVQVEAIDHVRHLLRSEDIDADAGVEGEVLVAHHPRAFKGLAAHRDLMAEAFGMRCELIEQAGMAERGFTAADTWGALVLPHGFPLHPLKYLRGLARAVQARGVTLWGSSEVVAWEREGARHLLHTAGGGTLAAETVIVATAGFTRDRLHPEFAGKLLPVLSNIVTTVPLTDEQRALAWRSPIMASDTRDLLHYFRMLPDGRMMFGARGGLSTGSAAVPAMRARVIADFLRFFPGLKGVEFSHFWRGLTDLSLDLLPHFGKAEEGSVYYALAWHGGGVAMGSWAGRMLAAQIAGNAPRLPAPLVQPLRRFPLSALRPAYLAGIYVAAGVRDRLGL